MSAFTNKLINLSAKYGIAWLIVNQTLGWISYIILYIFLERTSIDVVGWLSKYRILREVTGNLTPTAGNLVIAFAINRLGTPLRVFLTTWLMPYTAPFINGIVNPWLRKYGIRMDYAGLGADEPTAPHPMDEDFPGVEGDSGDPALVKRSKETKKTK